jgi:predicted RNase H-like nuclease (RuvC/YqgF family)
MEDKDEVIKNLQRRLEERAREVEYLRSLLDRIHALSLESIYPRSPQRTGEVGKTPSAGQTDFFW